MYNFLYITPTSTLIASEKKLLNKNNFTKVYNSKKSTVTSNYEGSKPEAIKDGCMQFIQANSIDTINSLTYIEGLAKENITRRYQVRKKESEARQKRMYAKLENETEEVFEKVSNEWNFHLFNAEFEKDMLDKYEVYKNIVDMSEVELEETVRNGYIKALANRKEVLNLNEVLYNKIEDDIRYADIELLFTFKDREDLLEKVKNDIEKSYEYWFSRPLRVENMKKYGVTETPTFSPEV